MWNKYAWADLYGEWDCVDPRSLRHSYDPDWCALCEGPCEELEDHDDKEDEGEEDSDDS